MYETARWSRNITASEAQAIYNAGVGRELETPSTPTVSGNTIINLTPDYGITLYSTVLDTGATGVDITAGETGLLIPDMT